MKIKVHITEKLSKYVTSLTSEGEGSKRVWRATLGTKREAKDFGNDPAETINALCRVENCFVRPASLVSR
jgi:hypothetical protein